jgi:hypothetical protein
MPPTKYKVWQWGGKVGDGVMQSEVVGLQGVAKKGDAGHPLTVANEYICGTLGRSACLPIPPAVIVDKEGEAYHVSLDFNLSGQRLPPADPAALVAALPQLACGIVLFDVWIVNGDRHTRNLSYDQAAQRVQLFDHGHAFLQSADPVAYLQQLRDRLWNGGHCLAAHLTSLDGMRFWFDRFNAIPEFFIRDTIESADGLGLAAALTPAVIDYVLERRGRLLEIVNINRATFTNVAADLWDQLVP